MKDLQFIYGLCKLSRPLEPASGRGVGSRGEKRRGGLRPASRPDQRHVTWTKNQADTKLSLHKQLPDWSRPPVSQHHRDIWLLQLPPACCLRNVVRLVSRSDKCVTGRDVSWLRNCDGIRDTAPLLLQLCCLAAGCQGDAVIGTIMQSSAHQGSPLSLFNLDLLINLLFLMCLNIYTTCIMMK